MRLSGRGSFVIAGLVLVFAVGLQWMRLRNMEAGDRSRGANPVKLTNRLPAASPGWVVRDEALGANETVRSEVEKVLNYDDYVFRIYQNGGREIGVYVAYWGAGRMPLQKVASHTPDRCWTENGWHCEDMRFAEVLNSGSQSLRAGQWRRFSPPGGQAAQYVVFWHLVGNQLYDYGDRFNARPDIVKWWRDTVRYAFSGSDAQYFIRVTSNRPFAEFAREPLWQDLVRTLADLGLKEVAVGAGSP